MSNTMNNFLLFTAASALLTTSVFAHAEPHIEQTFNISGQQQLDINVPVGSLELTTHQGSNVKVSIEFKAKNNNGFKSEIDLESITLDHQQNANKLSLNVDNDDIQQKWVVSLPTSMAIDLELGVGDIEVNDFANSADIDVGVGAVRISSELDDYKRIELDSGVGDTRVSNMKNDAQHTRKMVSSETLYRGNGQYSINVEVGVGDIKITR